MSLQWTVSRVSACIPRFIVVIQFVLGQLSAFFPLCSVNPPRSAIVEIAYRRKQARGGVGLCVRLCECCVF